MSADADDPAEATKKYNRVVLKLSGESFAEPGGGGLDPDRVHHIAQQCIEVQQLGVEVSLVVGGGWPERMRLLGLTRPVRLIEKFPWVGAGLGRADAFAVVAGVRRLGSGLVVSIQTDTGTLVVEGLASHNCYVRELHLGFEADGPTHSGHRRVHDMRRDEHIRVEYGVPVLRFLAATLLAVTRGVEQRVVAERTVQGFIDRHGHDVGHRRERARGLL